MTASDTLHALEAGLITQAEATEQALVDRLDDLYKQAAGRRRNVQMDRRYNADTGRQASR